MLTHCLVSFLSSTTPPRKPPWHLVTNMREQTWKAGKNKSKYILTKSLSSSKYPFMMRCGGVHSAGRSKAINRWMTLSCQSTHSHKVLRMLCLTHHLAKDSEKNNGIWHSLVFPSPGVDEVQITAVFYILSVHIWGDEKKYHCKAHVMSCAIAASWGPWKVWRFAAIQSNAQEMTSQAKPN